MTLDAKYHLLLFTSSVPVNTPSPGDTAYATLSSWLAKSTSGISTYLCDTKHGGQNYAWRNIGVVDVINETTSAYRPDVFHGSSPRRSRCHDCSTAVHAVDGDRILCAGIFAFHLLRKRVVQGGNTIFTFNCQIESVRYIYCHIVYILSQGVEYYPNWLPVTVTLKAGASQIYSTLGIQIPLTVIVSEEVATFCSSYAHLKNPKKRLVDCAQLGCANRQKTNLNFLCPMGTVGNGVQMTSPGRR